MVEAGSFSKAGRLVKAGSLLIMLLARGRLRSAGSFAKVGSLLIMLLARERLRLAGSFVKAGRLDHFYEPIAGHCYQNGKSEINSVNSNSPPVLGW